MQERISVWEGEGGLLKETSEKAMTGTVNQIEWAKQIKTQGVHGRIVDVLGEFEISEA